MTVAASQRTNLSARAAWAAIALAVVSLATACSEPPPKAGNGLAIMNRPATADDQLPAGFDKLPVAERVSDFAGARLARSVGGQKYYIVPGKSSSICLFWTSGEGDRIVGSGTCGARSEVNSKGVYLVSGGAPDKVSVAVIAPDGYDKATKLGEEVAVTNNLALFTAGEIGSVVLHGPNLTEQRIDLKDEGEPTPSISGTSN